MRTAFIFIVIFLFISSSKTLNGQVDSISQGERLLLEGFKKYEIGQIDSSIYIYEQAVIELKQQKNKNPIIEAYANLYALNSLLGNYSEASEAMIETEALFLEFLSPKDKNYSEVANSIGAYHKSKGNYSIALKYYNKALENATTPYYKARFLNNIATIIELQGDISKAIKILKKGINIITPLSPKTEKLLPILYRNLASNYKNNYQLDSAKYYFLKSRYLINKKEVSTNLNKKKFQVYNLMELTQIALDENELSLAEKYISEWEVIYSKKYSFRLYQLLLKKAKYYEKLGNKKKFSFYLDKSKQRTKERYSIYTKHPILGKPFETAAEIYLHSGEYKKGLDEIKKGLELITIEKKGEIENKFIGNLQGIDFLILKAQLESAIFSENNNIQYLKDCNKTYEHLSNLILKMRANVESQASELNWSQRLTEIYQSAVKNAITLYDTTNEKKYLEQAFYYSECNKAATLAEKVSYEKMLKSILPEDKWKGLQDLRIDIAFYQKQINSASQKTEQDSVKIAEWAQIIEDLKFEYEKSEKEIKEKYPDYATAIKTFKPSTVAEIRKGFLKDDIALIEYFSTKDSWYIFTLTKDDLKVEEVIWEKSFNLAFNGLIKQISQQPNSSTYVQGLTDFTNNSHTLYQFLLKNSLQTLPKAINSLLIISDGKLTYFPFELLLSQKPNQDATKTYSSSVMPYLFNNYNISYGFSATVVNLTHKNTQQNNSNESAIFAPSFSNEYIAENRSCQEDNLSYLQCNKTEGELINNLVKGKIFTGDLASIQQFREVASSAPILHLATHACVDEENEDGNKIFFTDTYLTNEDLNTIGVNADLVVLSACDTGLGKLIKGEGLMSLSRGFLCAGAASTVMSLWSVDDCATSDLMVNFYQELKNGNDKSTALKNAKLNYLAQADKLHQHPYFWAPFVLSGNVEPIESITRTSNLLYFSIGVIILFLIFFGYQKMKSQN